MNIIWKDSYLIGDPTIDQEHRQLFELSNELLAATDKGTLTLCVMKLYRHVRKHFAHEEKLMREIGFPDYLAHREEHNQLISQLNITAESIARDKWNSQDLYSLVSLWAGQHIPQSDVPLALYLQQSQKTGNGI